MLWRIWREKVESLAPIWHDRYPIPETRRSLIEKLGCIVAIGACLPSLANLENLIPEQEEERRVLFMDLYVLSWAVVLSVLLCGTESHTWFACFAFWIAAYRAFD